MKKDKSIIDILISLIKKKYKYIEKEFVAEEVLTSNLALINKSFGDSEEQEDFSSLGNLNEEEIKNILSILIKEDDESLKTNFEASCFLLKNDIDLVENQKEKLRELSYRANIKRRSLQKSIERREKSIETLCYYDELIDKLKVIKEEGYLDNDLVLEMFKNLNIKEEEQSELLDLVLEFNLNKIKELNKDIEVAEIETLAVEEIIDVDVIKEQPKITEDNLKDVFEKYGYDFSSINKESINDLLINGDLNKIEGIFTSLEKHHIDFLKVKNTKTGTLLTKLLLESSSEIIDKVGTTFRDAHIDKEFYKIYKPIFFSSIDEKDEERKKYTSNIKYGISSDSEDDNFKDIVPRRHTDFFKNLELLENYGYNKRDLIERQATLLMLPNSTVSKRIEQLKLYGYNIGDEKFALSTLISKNIMKLTDGFIEVGEEKYIYTYTSRITAYIDGTLERIYALREHNLPYKSSYSGNRLLLCVTNPKISCGLTEEEISNSIPKESESLLKGNKYANLLDENVAMKISDETLETSFVQELDDKFMETDKCYNFNGVLISRIKFLRNYEFLMKTDLINSDDKDTEQIVMVSAMHNSKLNMSQVQKINDAITGCLVVGGNNGLSKK